MCKGWEILFICHNLEAKKEEGSDAEILTS